MSSRLATRQLHTTLQMEILRQVGNTRGCPQMTKPSGEGGSGLTLFAHHSPSQDANFMRFIQCKLLYSTCGRNSA